MAKLTGVLQIEGSVGNLCFYKSNGGYFVRRKNLVSKSRIKNDASYARTRENMAEFTRAAGAGKLFRMAFRSLVQRAGSKGLSGRLLKTMMQVIKADDVNGRGERTMKDGQFHFLDGFEFNVNRTLINRVRAPFKGSIHRAQGVMTIDVAAFSAASVISAPEGATHFRLLSGGAAIDFENNTYNSEMSESDYLSVRREWVGPIQLVQKVAPGSSGVLFLVFGIEFTQLINGEQLALRDRTANAMAVVATSLAATSPPAP